MELERTYPRTVFSAEVIEEGIEHCSRLGEKPAELGRAHIKTGNDEWTFDTAPEFFNEYRREFRACSLSHDAGRVGLTVYVYQPNTTITASAADRATVEALIGIFDKHAAASRLPDAPDPPKPRPVVFIGHGKDDAWSKLKDHLHDLHGYDVEAYETGARAGHTIRDVLESMAERATFAVLVMTGDDETPGRGEPKTSRARQNVVHEVGLFSRQTRLGPSHRCPRGGRRAVLEPAGD